MDLSVQERHEEILCMSGTLLGRRKGSLRRLLMVAEHLNLSISTTLFCSTATHRIIGAGSVDESHQVDALASRTREAACKGIQANKPPRFPRLPNALLSSISCRMVWKQVRYAFQDNIFHRFGSFAKYDSVLQSIPLFCGQEPQFSVGQKRQQ